MPLSHFTPRAGFSKLANKPSDNENNVAHLFSFPALKQEEDNEELRFRLGTILQSTLDLNELMELFFRCIQQFVVTDGLIYRHSGYDIEITLGNTRAHHCDYRLITEDDNLGELIFSRKKRFLPEELLQFEIALGILVYPVRNALNYRLALRTALLDPLTETGNRIALDNALHRELQLAERYQQSLSLLMIDIDYFKKINDNHGHQSGDEILRHVADMIKTVTRETDMVFRYGGEEFVVVLSKTDTDGAKIIAERIRESVDTLNPKIGDEKIHTTVSIGISTLHEKEHIKELFQRADQALYLAKGQGRNQVAVEQ